MLTRVLDSCQIHIIPNRSTRLDLSTLVPIEGHKILAQAWVGGCIHHIQTKTNILVALDLQINISSINPIVYLLKAN